MPRHAVRCLYVSFYPASTPPTSSLPLTDQPLPSPAAVPASSTRPRVLLVGWDAADWQVIHPLLDAGRMPHLQRLVEGGASGNLASLAPMLSPILWTSIATGKRAYAHGVRGFVEPLADGSGIRPVGTRSRRTKALWNILAQNGKRSVVCGWMASHPAEPVPGAAVSNLFAVPPAGSTPDAWPVAEGSVQPPALAADIADLRIHPTEIEGIQIQTLIPRAHELDQRDPAVQHRLGFLQARLAEVLGIHATATDLLATQAWDFGAVYYECIDQVGHEFMPFHPPHRPEAVGEADSAFYGEVMARTYCLHDQMLGQLVELAGPGAHVLIVSDHGFESGARRPRGPVEPARWHRGQGVCVLHGPGIAPDATVEGATLLDIAPTVLTLFGLPVGADMEGKPLAAAWETPPTLPERIPSWEEIPGDDGRLPPDPGETDPAAARALLAQFVALGYVEDPGDDARAAGARAEAEADFNLAAALVEGHRAPEAKALLIPLTERHPDEPRYWHARVQACLAARTPEEAAPCLEALDRLEPGQGRTVVLRGLLAWGRGDMDGSLAAFGEAARLAPDDPVTQTYLGRVALRQRRWTDAQRAFEHALTVDPDLAEAHYGLSVALPRQGDDFVETGVAHALRAVGLRFEFPEAHFQLGAVLSRLGWFERAAQAFEVTLRLRPGFVLAHRYLGRVYGRLGRDDSARRHREEAARLLAINAAQPPVD